MRYNSCIASDVLKLSKQRGTPNAHARGYGHAWFRDEPGMGLTRYCASGLSSLNAKFVRLRGGKTGRQRCTKASPEPQTHVFPVAYVRSPDMHHRRVPRGRPAPGPPEPQCRNDFFLRQTQCRVFHQMFGIPPALLAKRTSCASCSALKCTSNDWIDKLGFLRMSAPLRERVRDRRNRLSYLQFRRGLRLTGRYNDLSGNEPPVARSTAYGG